MHYSDFLLHRYIGIDVNMNVPIWFLMLISIILLYAFSFQYQINTVSIKLVIMAFYFSALLLFDKYYVKSINWNQIRKFTLFP